MSENLFKLETYNYSLSKELIAQYPIKKRDESRLLCYKKDKSTINHYTFHDLPDLLSSNDVLVLNNTKVIPARFYVKNEKGKEIEILLVSSVSPDNLTWKVLARKGLPRQTFVSITKSEMKINIEFINQDTIKFDSHKDLEIILNQIGQMPLPPYIKRSPEDIDTNRYQTIFAKEPGAVAAPTAGLHFTDEVINKLKKKRIEIFYITLHVGPGTFLPIRTDNISEHKLIPESFYIDKETWEKIQESKKNKKRIIACGTTTVRALEYAARVEKLSGLTSLFITPGFEFKVVDALITNFHLPKTTLLVLVSAFLEWGKVSKIYNEAIKEKYRFYSYGDAMMIC